MYSEIVMDHFNHPRNTGVIESIDEGFLSCIDLN